MGATLLIMILWTWGLTPLWVNIVGTIFCGVKLILNLIGYSLGKRIGEEVGQLLKEYTDDQE